MPDSGKGSTTESHSQRPVWLGQDRRKWDHARVHVQLLQDHRIGAYELAVYLGLAAHAECMSGRAFPAAATLARYATMSERKVRECVRTLAEAGYLTVQNHVGKASTYSLLPPPKLSTPRHLVPGSEGDPGTTVQTPRHVLPNTPAPGADEREPVTRTKNERAAQKFSTPHVDPKKASATIEQMRQASGFHSRRDG